MENKTALQRIQSILHSDQETLVLHCSNPNLKRDREEGETASIEDLRQENRDLLAKIQRLEGKLTAVEDNLKCNRCFEKSDDDVLLKCGHNLCRPCLTSWSGTGRTAGRTCSLCRKPTSEANQSEHLAFRRVVEAVKYTKVYPNGEKYIGDLEGEKRHGQGACFYPNGNKYEGGWREDSMFGQGVYTWKDGSFYKGEFLRGNRSKDGLMTWASGQTYKGGWRLSYDESKDTIDEEEEYVDSRYFGFKIGHSLNINKVADNANDLYWMRHVNGVHTWPDGKQFKGQFDDGEKIEVGEMTWPNGDRFICYEWEDNIPMGKAEYAWTDGCKLADLNSDWYDKSRLLFPYEISRKLRFSERLGHHCGYFEGQWLGRDWCGHGKVVYPRIESEYEGTFQDNRRSGHGRAKNSDGSTYTGDWENNKRHGKGTAENSKGTYEGEWQLDKKHGHGKFAWKNGEWYEGSWNNDKREGKGTMHFWINGVYEGEWKDDKKHGVGIITSRSGSYRVEGSFENDKLHGHVKEVERDLQYEGEFKEGKRNGQGKMKFSNGNVYEGQFFSNWRHGRGTFTWGNGDRYTGFLKYDHKHGLGAMFYHNGDKFEGWWQNNKKEGRGTWTLSSGVKWEGIWFDDKKLPDASSLDTDKLIVLVVGLPPDIAKEVLRDAFYARLTSSEWAACVNSTGKTANDLADTILKETSEMYKIVNMLQDDELFDNAIRLAKRKLR